MRFASVAVAAVALTFTGCGDSNETTAAPTTVSTTSIASTTAAPTTGSSTTGDATTGSSKTGKVTTGSATTTSTGTSTKFMSTTAAPTSKYCTKGDDFCKSQTVGGGDFASSHCKYYMEASVCQAPVGSTDVAMMHIPCSCDDGSVTVTSKSPVTSVVPTEAPTDAPTEAPTDAPTEAPTDAPTEAPTEAPVPTPSGKYCGTVSVFGMPFQGSVAVSPEDTLAFAVEGVADVKDVKYTLGANGEFNIDFSSESIAALLKQFKIDVADAPNVIKARYNADDTITVTLPIVGEFAVAKSECTQ